MYSPISSPRRRGPPRPLPRRRPPPLPPTPSRHLPGSRLPRGFKAELFAAEPRVVNIASFHIDERGRFYVVEVFRRRGATLDMRKLPDWLDDDLACRTVADRIAMVKRRMTPEQVEALEKAIRPRPPVEDRDGDGKADLDTVFADGFNKLEDGIAAGVLARDGDVYFANIPNLWLLRDTDGDGKADVRKSLHYGYGVRYAFLGHDLHGLRFGPDGKLYFSVGDRGLHVEKPTARSLVSNPDSGAVLRCNPDGIEPGARPHRPAQPAGAGVRRVRQPLHRRQQLRRRRRGPLGPRRRGRRQRLAHRLPAPGLPRQPRPVERRAALGREPADARALLPSCRRSPTRRSPGPRG